MTKQAMGEAVRVAANNYKIPYANLRAVVEVESDGVVYATVNGRVEPLIRFEGHIFDRRLSKAQQTIARAKGLASSKVGGVPNPKDQNARWNNLLIPASKINHDAAYESCSWGLGQVMGYHWKAFGYSGVMDLVTKARKGIDGQIELMMRYCVINDLIDELQRGDFTAFARAYNGPGYAANNYDGKMRDAAEKFGGIPIPTVPDGVTKTMFRMGSKGRTVREIQALLLRAGYAIKIDGDFGTATKQAVKQLQMHHKITIDGIVGPETWRVLDGYRVAGEEQPGGATVTETPQGVQGFVAAIIGAIIAAFANLSPEAAKELVAAIGIIISVGGGLWAAWGYKKANDDDDKDK